MEKLSKTNGVPSHPHAMLGTRFGLYNEKEELTQMNEVLTRILNAKNKELKKWKTLSRYLISLTTLLIIFAIYSAN